MPYAVLGLLAGAYVDRWRRKPVLVWSSVGRAVTLGLVPVVGLVGLLQPWVLVLVLLAFGSFSVFGFAATQSLLPRLVPAGDRQRTDRPDRRDCSDSRPGLGGALIGVVGAPLTIAVQAVGFLVEALLVASIKVEEPRRSRVGRNLRAEVVEGLKWTYQHSVLGRLAVSTHVWFLANGAGMTALSLLALRSLDFSAAAYGLLFTLFGVAMLVGALLAPVAGSRLGSGRVVLLARAAYPLAWLLPAFAGPENLGRILVFVGLAVLGLSAGLENSNEMGLWQTLTPDELLGRVNGARRSINRTLAAVGAVAGGVLIGVAGDRGTLITCVVVFAIAAVMVSGRAGRTRCAFGSARCTGQVGGEACRPHRRGSGQGLMKAGLWSWTMLPPQPPLPPRKRSTKSRSARTRACAVVNLWLTKEGRPSRV